MRFAIVAVALLSACSSSSEPTPEPSQQATPPTIGDVESFAEVPSTEGIAFANNTLYVSSAGALHRVDSKGAAERWVDVAGALGIAARSDGHLLVCGKGDGGGGVIWKVAPDGNKTVLVGPSAGIDLKQTNFVAIAPDDSIVFSDSGADRVYRANGDGSGVTQLTDAIVYPNGLAFAKDGKQLYVASWKTKKVFSLARNGDGTYAAPIVAVDGVENVDGLVVGESGDLYLVANGLGVIRVRAGKQETIATGSSFKLAANGAFGPSTYGPGWLYVTNLIGPSVSRVYVGESGAPLPVR